MSNAENNFFIRIIVGLMTAFSIMLLTIKFVPAYADSEDISKPSYFKIETSKSASSISYNKLVEQLNDYLTYANENSQGKVPLYIKLTTGDTESWTIQDCYLTQYQNYNLIKLNTSARTIAEYQVTFDSNGDSKCKEISITGFDKYKSYFKTNDFLTGLKMLIYAHTNVFYGQKDLFETYVSNATSYGLSNDYSAVIDKNVEAKERFNCNFYFVINDAHSDCLECSVYQSVMPKDAIIYEINISTKNITRISKTTTLAISKQVVPIEGELFRTCLLNMTNDHEYSTGIVNAIDALVNNTDIPDDYFAVSLGVEKASNVKENGKVDNFNTKYFKNHSGNDFFTNEQLTEISSYLTYANEKTSTAPLYIAITGRTNPKNQSYFSGLKGTAYQKYEVDLYNRTLSFDAEITEMRPLGEVLFTDINSVDESNYYDYFHINDFYNGIMSMIYNRTGIFPNYYDFKSKKIVDFTENSYEISETDLAEFNELEKELNNRKLDFYFVFFDNSKKYLIDVADEFDMPPNSITIFCNTEATQATFYSPNMDVHQLNLIDYYHENQNLITEGKNFEFAKVMMQSFIKTHEIDVVAPTVVPEEVETVFSDTKSSVNKTLKIILTIIMWIAIVSVCVVMLILVRAFVGLAHAEYTNEKSALSLFKGGTKLLKSDFSKFKSDILQNINDTDTLAYKDIENTNINEIPDIMPEETIIDKVNEKTDVLTNKVTNDKLGLLNDLPSIINSSMPQKLSDKELASLQDEIEKIIKLEPNNKNFEKINKVYNKYINLSFADQCKIERKFSAKLEKLNNQSESARTSSFPLA